MGILRHKMSYTAAMRTSTSKGAAKAMGSWDMSNFLRPNYTLGPGNSGEMQMILQKRVLN